MTEVCPFLTKNRNAEQRDTKIYKINNSPNIEKGRDV